MKILIGIFPSLAEADGAVRRLRETGVASDGLKLIPPNGFHTKGILSGKGLRDKRAMYEDALRLGHALVVVQVNEGTPADTAEIVLQQAGAQRLDATRQY